jgi:parallel beta-helix repeat protein
MTRLARLSVLLALTAAVFGVQQAAAATRQVPANYPTIQAAINASADGDTVLVAPGTYVERIDFSHKSITVESSGGPTITTIDGDAAGVVVAMATDAGETPILRGFTITNGDGDLGGAIATSGGPALIEENRVTNNLYCSAGTVYAASSAATIRDNVISDNHQSGCGGGTGGGGIMLGGTGTVHVVDNVISGNSAPYGGGISLNAAGAPTIRGNVISGNSAVEGGGISLVNDSDPVIENNLIIGNAASTQGWSGGDVGDGGGIYWLVPAGATGPTLVNNTIAGNTAVDGLAVFAHGFDDQSKLKNNILVGSGAAAVLSCGSVYGPSPPQITYNDVINTGAGAAYGGTCTDQTGQSGNISADPRFVGAQNFHLKASSPAIDAGTNTGAPDDDLDHATRPIDGDADTIATVDMGAYEFAGPTMSVSPGSVPFGSSGNTLVFTYVAAAPMDHGAISLTVPAGWSAPSLTSSDPGYVKASRGVVGVSGRKIVVSSLTLQVGGSLTVRYGARVEGPGANAPSVAGAQTWAAAWQEDESGQMMPLAISPRVTVLSPDGSGVMTVTPQFVRPSSTGNTLTFAYTAATGGISSGAVTLKVPAGWSVPSTSALSPGYVVTSVGHISVSGSLITVSALTLAKGNTLKITYGSKAGGGPGASAPANGGGQTWAGTERSSEAGTRLPLASSPTVTVLSPDGAGTLTTPTASVVHSSGGNTITFTYTAAAGGLNNGALRLTVPVGWSAPSTTGTSPGYSTASSGALSVSGRVITVGGVTLAGGQTLTIVYGSKTAGGSGAIAPSSPGSQLWQAQERSSIAGVFANLANSPAIQVT